MLGVKAMKELGLTGLPVTHIENASATGLVAFREAAWAVASGRAEVAMAIGFDKMTEMGRGSASSRGTGRDQLDATILPAAYFALWAQRRMHDYGTTPRDLRRHRRQELEPRRPLPVERPPARPHRHRGGGAGVADGGRAAHRDDGVPGRRRRRLRDPRVHRVGEAPPPRPPARAAGGVGAPQRDLLAGPHLPRTGRRPGDDDAGHRAARLRAKPASVPTTSHLALCHDAFANEELEYYELLGFCRDGEGDKLVAEGATALGGRIPFNTDGGLIARGHPAGPTGLAMVHEVVQQLRGEAGQRQVEGARTALAHLVGGGSICTVSLFEAD